MHRSVIGDLIAGHLKAQQSYMRERGVGGEEKKKKKRLVGLCCKLKKGQARVPRTFLTQTQLYRDCTEEKKLEKGENNILEIHYWEALENTSQNCKPTEHLRKTGKNSEKEGA